MTSLQQSSHTPDPDADTFERRWDAWQAKTHTRETRTPARGRAALAVLVLVVGGTFVWLVAGG